MEHSRPTFSPAARLCLGFSTLFLLAAFSVRVAAQTSAANTNETALAPGESEYDFGTADSPAALAERAAATVARFMPETHVTHQRFTDALSPVAWTNYLNSFDSEHIYFTQEDEREFEPRRTDFLSRIAEGDVSFGEQVFRRYVQRVEERNNFVGTILSNQWDDVTADTYTFRRNATPLPRPADLDEQNALWEARIRNILLETRIGCEIANVNASNRYEKALARAEASTNAPAARAAAYTALTNAVRTVDEAVEEARKTIRESNERYLAILRDADQEMWFSKYLTAATQAYDPHSTYMSPAGAEDFGIDMQLSLQGIGAQLQSDAGTAKVVSIVPGSPADRDTSPNRLEPGDRIVGVAQGDEEFVDIRHWPLYKAVRLIRGPRGTTVRLRVIPVSKPDGEKIVTLVREEIKMEEQAASSRVETVLDSFGAERKLGYIKLPAFYAGVGQNGSTPRRASVDVAEQIAAFNEQGVEGMILDLRNNGGGSLPEAVYLTGLFIRKGPVVLVKESRRPAILPDNNPAIAFNKPLVILVNRLSASASEIVAAALQDYGRAVIVGDDSTHGKGTVQTLIPLEDGKLGSLKTTTAMFYRISGASTQLRGVKSDIHLPSIFEAYSELGEDKMPGALRWTRIPPAMYQPVCNLGDIIPELRNRSAGRIATNTAWQARLRLIDRFRASNTNITQSLDYEKRRATAIEDNEIAEQVREITFGNEEIPEDGDDEFSLTGDAVAEPEEAGDDKEDREARKRRREEQARKADIVLDEALQILVDLIDFHPETTPAGNPSFDFLDLFFR